MPVVYTNRKGITYHLCRGVTKTGKPRYYFAREPKGEPVEEVPEGWKISESVNGIVSLVRERPAQIRPEEVESVESMVRRHPKSRNYRVAVKENRIEIYERAGLSADELISVMRGAGLLELGQADRLEDALGDTLDRRAQFTPVLRFTLVDAENRTFRIERMCYRSSVDGWIDVGSLGQVDRLARQMVPTLGSDRFFELF
jgi:hypothetical protein